MTTFAKANYGYKMKEKNAQAAFLTPLAPPNSVKSGSHEFTKVEFCDNKTIG